VIDRSEGPDIRRVPKKPDPIQPIYRLIGAKIEQMRSQIGWTQDDLAKRIKLTRTSVTNIEAGRQRLLLHQIDDIAAAFQTTPKHLLRGVWL
jgi:DNA-binding XRE family transcriptional regulator